MFIHSDSFINMALSLLWFTKLIIISNGWLWLRTLIVFNHGFYGNVTLQCLFWLINYRMWHIAQIYYIYTKHEGNRCDIYTEYIPNGVENLYWLPSFCVFASCLSASCIEEAPGFFIFSHILKSPRPSHRISPQFSLE